MQYGRRKHLTIDWHRPEAYKHEKTTACEGSGANSDRPTDRAKRGREGGRRVLFLKSAN